MLDIDYVRFFGSRHRGPFYEEQGEFGGVAEGTHTHIKSEREAHSPMSFDKDSVFGVCFVISTGIKGCHSTSCPYSFRLQRSRQFRPVLVAFIARSFSRKKADVLYGAPGVKIQPQGTVGFGPCFYLPGIHVGYLFLTHTQLFSCANAAFKLTAQSKLSQHSDWQRSICPHCSQPIRQMLLSLVSSRAC